MNGSGRFLRAVIERLYGFLLGLYPPGFRAEFALEIRAIFSEVLREAEERGLLPLVVTAGREFAGLWFSVLREWSNEGFTRRRGEKKMAAKEIIPTEAGPALQPVRAPSLVWAAGWMLLTTVTIPIALFSAAPLGFVLLALLGLGTRAGLWPAVPSSSAGAIGFLFALGLEMASVQWFLLRRFLPRAWLWFVATAASLMLYGFFGSLVLSLPLAQNWDSYSIFVAVLLPAGLALGVGQWLYLRRFLQRAFWIIVIDLLAAGSLLLFGKTITNLGELSVFLLPGTITGIGVWMLLSQSGALSAMPVPIETRRKKISRLPRLVRVGLGLLALVPLFFGGSWAYATSQLALAKNNGVYPTVEQAVIGYNSVAWGGAKVLRVENIQTGPSYGDGSHPHVWFGTATVILDRIPRGYNKTQYNGGSFYIHVREGWVLVPEGAFPEFIGWVMELYGLEGVQR